MNKENEEKSSWRPEGEATPDYDQKLFETLKYIEQEEYELATKTLDTIIDENPNDGTLWGMRASIEIAQENYHGATKSALEYVKRCPFNIEALSILGTAQLGSANYRGAEQTFKLYLQICPDDDQAKTCLETAQNALRAIDGN